MADAIRRRMVSQDEFTDDQVEPALDAFRRYSLRQRVRLAWNGSADFSIGGRSGIVGSVADGSVGVSFFWRGMGRRWKLSAPFCSGGGFVSWMWRES